MDIASDGIAHYYLMEIIKSNYGLKKDVETLTKEYNESVAKSYAVADCVYRNGLETSMQTLSNLLSNENVKLDKDFSSWFRKIYLEVHAKHVRLFPEVIDVLKELRNRGIPLGLVSDVDNDFIYSQLEVHNIKEFFTTIVTSEEVGVCKPHKKIFEVALNRANARAEESIYIGDHAERDMMGAKKIGMTTIIRGKLCKYADYSINDLRELLPIVTNSGKNSCS